MGYGVGERTLFTITNGRSIQVSADGKPDFKAGGITVNWDLVPAQTAEVTFYDTVTVPAGAKVLRYGSIVYRDTDGRFGLATAATSLVRGETFIINETWEESENMSLYPGALRGGLCFKDRILAGVSATNEVQKLTVTATGGTFDLVFTNAAGVVASTGAIAYNANAGTLQSALEALSNIGSGNVAVSKTGADFNITFQGTLANTDVPNIVVDGGLATGGTVVQSVTTQGNAGTPSFSSLNTAMPTLEYVIN